MDILTEQNLEQKQLEGIKEMRILNEEFLKKGKASPAVLEFMRKAHDDKEKLLRYLIGRKYKPKHAWETLKRNAEVRLEIYPEVFPDVMPTIGLVLRDNHTFGVLKQRDSLGRRIGYFNASNWDPDEISMDVLMMLATSFVDRVMSDEDAMNNGFIFIQQCSGMGFKHAKQYTVNAMIRVLDLFYFAHPIKLKGVYYINLPTFLTFMYGIAKPLIPHKMKDRFIVSSTSKKFEALHENLDPTYFPPCLGGTLSYEEALDLELFR